MATAAELKKIWTVRKKDDDTLIIKSYKGTDIDVIVPSEIGKNIVSEIDSETFSPNATRITQEQIDIRKSIKSIVIPGTVKKIPVGMFCFYKPALEKVVIDEGVTAIGKNAFKGCHMLTEISLPDGLEIIEDDAFHDCSKLERITFPESLLEIRMGAFYGCEALKEIMLPAGLKSIGNYCFYSCKSLSEINIPQGIKEINNFTFSRCGFSKFVIPPQVTRIGIRAFSQCSSLKEIKLHADIKKIDNLAFEDCEMLSKLEIPGKEITIGERIVKGCKLMADEHGFIVFNDTLQDYVPAEDTDVVEVPDYIDEIPPELKLGMPRFVYKKNSRFVTAMPNFSTVNIGDEIEYGQFPVDSSLEMKPLKWIVIAKENNKFLVITKDSIVALYSTHVSPYMGTWEESPYRKWTNGPFFRNAFSTEEQNEIAEELLTNPDNTKEKMPGGNDTKDKVFLLSLREIKKYFPEENKRCSVMTDYARTQSQTKRDTSSWILRTPGSWDSVNVSNFDGNVDLKGNRVGFRTIRPAMWIKIQ